MLEGIVLRKLRSNQRLEAMTRRMAHRMGLVRGSLHKRRAPPYGPVVFRSPGAVARGAQQSTISLKCLSDFQACERETRRGLERLEPGRSGGIEATTVGPIRFAALPSGDGLGGTRREGSASSWP